MGSRAAVPPGPHSAGQRHRHAADRTRAELASRLQGRRAEIEEVVLARLYAVSDPSEQGPEYLEGLRAALAAGLTYALAGIERGEERCGPIPAAVLTQARQAAREGVGLETVLRRYVAGYTVLSDFVLQEVRRGHAPFPAAALQSMQGEMAALLDRLLAALGAEHRREAESSALAPAQRRAERVKRLLAGEPLDTAELDYDFDAHHLGAIATGPGAERLLRDLAASLDRRLLLVSPGEPTFWAWLGGRREFDPADLASPPPGAWAPGVSLALGEPAPGPRGWRLTHRQAEVALTVARRRPQPLTRYADVAFLAAILRDEDLLAFLADTYLVPLGSERDGGETMRRTLRAYFAAGRNASSAGAALGVARQTITSRLRVVEERLGRPLGACGAELEAALRLGELDPPSVRRSSLEEPMSSAAT